MWKSEWQKNCSISTLCGQKLKSLILQLINILWKQLNCSFFYSVKIQGNLPRIWLSLQNKIPEKKVCPHVGWSETLQWPHGWTGTNHWFCPRALFDPPWAKNKADFENISSHSAPSIKSPFMKSKCEDIENIFTKILIFDSFECVKIKFWTFLKQ